MELLDIERYLGSADVSGAIDLRRKEGKASRAHYGALLQGKAARFTHGIRVAQLRRDRDRLLVLVKSQQERLRTLQELTERDPLTGILNRRGFERAARTALAHILRFGTNICMVYLDLDGLKAVNDIRGHDVGDQVLVAVCNALAARLRKVDVLARLGGDEFAILLWDSKRSTARRLAGQLATIVGDVARGLGVESELTGASCGVTRLDARAPLGEQLKRADAAMYLDKRRRRCP